MLIRNRLMRNPGTVTSQDTLATAQKKMTVGRFRHLPVVEVNLPKRLFLSKRGSRRAAIS